MTNLTPISAHPARRWRRSPSMASLFDDYAAQRRIDSSAPITANESVIVDAPVNAVWEVLSTPQQWPRVDQRISDVKVDGVVAAGTSFTWRNGRTRLRSRFAVVDPLHELTWTGQATGARVVHRHVLSAMNDGRTRLDSEESMSGPLIAMLFSNAKLEAVLKHWLAAIAERAESRPAVPRAIPDVDSPA